MAQKYPSIQSFYQREVVGDKSPEPSSPIKAGDGFTEQELADFLDPLNRKWNPEREYEELTIEKVTPGPRAVTFAGRIVNIRTQYGRTQTAPKATGWHHLIIKDDSAAISIKLFFAKAPYPLKLGQLLTVWTVFISDASKADIMSIPNINIYANVFPGRVTSDHVMLHTTSSTDTICRTPLEYRNRQELPGLLTLDSYIRSGGHDDVSGVKLLLCVKSIGARKKFPKKDGTGEVELADVLLFDNTGEVSMTVWNEVIESVREWVPGKTIILLSNPGFQVGRFSNKGKVAIARGSMVDIDPVFADAEWLRKYAEGLTKNESLCLEIPEGIWDVEASKYGIVRMLFTLADLDKWVRADPQQVFSGFINVVITELSLVKLHRRNMLMVANCCGLPQFSNSPTTKCRNCSTALKMQLNPRIFGTLLDETGCIAPGMLVWSDDAWRDVFDRSPEEIAALTGEECGLFEQRLLWMRVHLVVGWWEGVGRLVVLGMMS